MMKQTFLHGALGMSLMLGMALGTSAQLSLSMEQAQALGVQHAYDMQRARIDVEVAKRDVKELLATGLPQVNASVDLNHFLDIPTCPSPVLLRLIPTSLSFSEEWLRQLASHSTLRPRTHTVNFNSAPARP